MNALPRRARANIVREMLYADKNDPWDSSEMHDILDLCLACKGCKSECPSGVDMAKLKSEFLQHYNDSHRAPLRSSLIASLPDNRQALFVHSRYLQPLCIKQDYFIMPLKG